MRYSFQKKLWWSLLVVGIGGMLLFILVIAVERRIPKAEHFAIPISGFLFSWLSTARLITCYRAEPAASDTRWQLSIKDFMALTFFEGLLLSYFKLTIPVLFFNLGIPFALATAIFSVLGALVASRKNIVSLQRPVYACGFALMTIGGLLSGGLFILLAILSIFSRMNPMEPIYDILGRRNDWPVVMFRIGLIYLVFGLLACTLASKRSNPDQTSYPD